MSADVRKNKRPAVIDRRYSAISLHLQSLSAQAAKPQVIAQQVDLAPGRPQGPPLRQTQVFRGGLGGLALGKRPPKPEELQGAAGVFLDLELEDGGVLELDFIAQAVEEFDFHIRLGNFTARKVQEEGLDGQSLIVTKSRFVADVGDGIVEHLADSCAGDVHTGLGQLFLDGSKVESRDGVLASHSHAGHNRPINGEGPAQEPIGNVNTALHQQFPDAGAGNPLSAHFKQGQHFHFETLLPAQLFQNFHVPRLTVSKAEIRSHVDRHGVQRLDEDFADELEGGEVRQLPVESQDNQQVDAAAGDEPGFSGKGGEQFWSVSGGKKLDGMGLKGNGGSHRVSRTGKSYHALQKLLMRAMHSIEVPDGQHASGRRRPQFAEIVNDAHKSVEKSRVEESKVEESLTFRPSTLEHYVILSEAKNLCGCFNSSTSRLSTLDSSTPLTLQLQSIVSQAHVWGKPGVGFLMSQLVGDMGAVTFSNS